MDEIKKRIEAGRAFTHWSEEDYKSDQMLKRTQPPLVKEAISDERISLPKNFTDLSMENDLVKLIYMRRSYRVYTEKEIDLLTLSFLLWAQQGIKSIRGNNYATLRTVPSGGARHPFELYMVILHVEGLKPGFYHYLPMDHELELLKEADPSDQTFRKDVSDSLCEQKWALKASVIFYYSMIPYRGEWRYSFDAHRPMLIDAGHVSQNLYLACTATGLGTCAIAACDSPLASKLFDLDGVEEYMFYSCPVGTIDVSNEEEEQAFYAFLKEEE